MERTLGHRRLYEYLKGKTTELPETIEEMAPLYAAVVHGCRAARNQEALEEVWWRRISRMQMAFSLKKLGAFGSEAALFSAFFDSPWDHLAPGLTEADQALVLNEAGVALRALGRLREAAALTQAGLERTIAQGDWQNAAISTYNASLILRLRGALYDASAQAQRSVEFADTSDNIDLQVLARTTLGVTQYALGARTKAIAIFEQAEQMQSEWLPDYPLLFSSRGFGYCDILLDEGLYSDVQNRAEQTLEWAQAHSVLLDIGLDHLSLGRAHVLTVRRGLGGDSDYAVFHLDRAVDGLRRAGQEEYLPLGLLARAALHTQTRAFDLAHKDLDEALRIATRCGFRLHEADAHLGYARLALAEGAPSAALDQLERARKIVDETGYHRRDGELAELRAEADERAKAAPPPPATPAPVPSPPASTPAPPLQQAPVPTSKPSSAGAPVDFLLFAPLEEERDALLSKLPGHRKLEGDGTDVHVYYEAELPTRRRDGATYRVIVTSPAGMGPIQAAITASAATARWRPEHVVVVGIAGGLKDEVATGDVIVARSVADYTVGKVSEDGTREERWEMYPADPTLLNAASAFREGWTDLVAQARPEAEGAPARHAGVIASGGDVIASKDLIAAYRKDMPKLIGVEMEGGGVAAALHGHVLRPRFLMVRGVSDLADAKGNAATKKRWRAYARDVAAAHAVGLLREGPVPATRRTVDATAQTPGVATQGSAAPAPRPTAQGTRWPAKLSGVEVQELVDALLSAFPTRSALAQMVRVGLDENLEALAAGGNLRDTLFELVRHAEAQGLVPALFEAALAAASGNPDLHTLAAKRRA